VGSGYRSGWGQRCLHRAAVVAMAAAALFLSSCDFPSLRDLDIPPASGKSSLMLLPSTVNLKTGESITFTATGGTTPYTFTVEPAEPDGGTIDAGVTTALYTAPPTAGTYIVTVTDRSNNSTEATVMATAAIPLSVTPVSSTVPVGAVVTLVASGGNGSYEFVPPGTGILIHSGSSNMATYQPTPGPRSR
jgi:hypothetical protein